MHGIFQAGKMCECTDQILFLIRLFLILNFGFDVFGRIWQVCHSSTSLEENFLRDFVWIMFLQSFQAIRKIWGDLHQSGESFAIFLFSGRGECMSHLGTKKYRSSMLYVNNFFLIFTFMSNKHRKVAKGKGYSSEIDLEVKKVIQSNCLLNIKVYLSFISNENALRRPMTYDIHPSHQSHPHI